MSDHQAPKRVFCVRNQQMKDVDEHIRCPYCFGRLRAAVEGGDRTEFCDFDPEADPVSFGFPQDSSRNLRG